MKCSVHSLEMVCAGAGYFRCPQSVHCREFRMTVCNAPLPRPKVRTGKGFLNRVCREDAKVEAWVVFEDGRETYHGSRCLKHQFTIKGLFSEGIGRIEYREVAR